jgi:la-related protein 1
MSSNYYFSVDNLCKDMYLRKHMDNDGYVRLSFLMGFQRVQLHTKDINILRDACLASQEIQLTYGVDDMYVRKKDGWENWVLSESVRDESAKRGMSDWHFDPRQRQQNGANMTPPGEMSGSAEPFFPGAPTMAPQFYPQPINTAYGYPVQPTPLSATVPEFSPSSQFAQHGLEAPFNPSVPRHAADEVPDTHFDSVMVVSQPQRPSTRDGAPASPESSPNRQANGVNGDGAHDESGKTNGNPTDQKHRSYTEVRAQAIKYRESGVQGKNNDLITLYRFWSHCLVRTFNTNIYKEFKHFALQDADMSLRYGIEQIFKMYEMSFKDRATIGYDVIRDFVDLVKTEVRHGEQYGIDKLRSILANPSLKEDYRQAIDSLLDDQLRGFLGQNAGKKAQAPEPYKAVCSSPFRLH